MWELFDGVFHWKARHPKIGIEVGCHFVAASGTAIDPLLPAEGMEWFDEHPPRRIGFAFGDRLADDVVTLEMDSISPDDTVLRIEADAGALLFADSVIHYGSLGFVPDKLIGDDPEAVKATVRQRCGALLAEDFSHLLFAHGEPLLDDGPAALREFAKGVECGNDDERHGE